MFTKEQNRDAKLSQTCEKVKEEAEAAELQKVLNQQEEERRIKV